MTATSTASAMFLSIGRNLFDYYHFSVFHVVPCFIIFFFIRLSGMFFLLLLEGTATAWWQSSGSLPAVRMSSSPSPTLLHSEDRFDGRHHRRQIAHNVGIFFELGADWAPGSATQALMMRLVAETFSPTGRHSNPQLFFAFQFQIHSNSKIWKSKISGSATRALTMRLVAETFSPTGCLLNSIGYRFKSATAFRFSIANSIQFQNLN